MLSSGDRGLECDGVGLRRCRRDVQLPRDGVGVVPLGVFSARGPDSRVPLYYQIHVLIGLALFALAVHPAGTRSTLISFARTSSTAAARAGANAAAVARVTGVRLRRADRTAHRDRR